MTNLLSQSRLLALGSATLMLAFVGCGQAADETATQAEQEDAGESITIWTDSTELYLEHPPLVAGQSGEPWAVHLTALRDFKAVAQGVLTLRFVGPDDQEYVTAQEVPSRPGVYTPAPSFPVAGTYDLVMELEGPDVTDEIYVGPVLVYASHDDIPQLEPEPPVGITFLKEQQWPIPFATVAAETREMPRAIAANGEVIPTASRLAHVTAPVDGIILAQSNRSAPASGQWVERGQRLAVLSPTPGENAYAAQRASAERLEREVARAERLYEAEAIPKRRLEEAQHDLEVVRATLAAMGAPENGDYDLTLRAPIAGVVNERNFAIGARVGAGDLLYTLVDARHVWLRLYVSANNAESVSQTTGATFTVEGGTHVHRSDRVVSVGRTIDPERRSLPVIFEVANTDERLRVGMLAEGRLLVGDPVTGVAIPNSGIRDEDGILVAYVQIGGESFERRALTIGPTDGEWTIVLSGVRRGERVVTLGAYQIRLASLNTSEFSDHGHPH